MHFVELTSAASHSPIYINMEHVSEMYREEGGERTTVVFAVAYGEALDHVTVIETPNEILRAC